MQDSMTIWDSICNSQWFKRTSIVSIDFVLSARLVISPSQVLFLNKNDLFEKKIHNSDIRKHFAVSTATVYHDTAQLLICV